MEVCMAQSFGDTLRNKMDRFFRVLFFTEQGRPKSAMFLYSFCLSLLFFALYALSYGFLIDVLERAFTGESVLVRNILQSILPGLAATLVCCSMFFLFPDKRLVPVAYIWLAAYALAALIIMLAITSKDEFRIFLFFFTLLVPFGLICGGTISFTLLRRDRRRKEQRKAEC